MNEIKTDYDSFLAEIYDYSPYFGKERREKDYATQFYLDNLPDKNKGKILELVTCTGLLTIPMARAGYKIDSIDVSPAVHEIVRRKMANEPKKVINNITLKISTTSIIGNFSRNNSYLYFSNAFEYPSLSPAFINSSIDSFHFFCLNNAFANPWRARG